MEQLKSFCRLINCRKSEYKVIDMYKKGFTLIELLVVMAIIALLSAVIFPISATVRSKVEQNTCMQNLKEIGLGVDMYYSDHKQYPSALAPDVEYDEGGDLIPMEERTGNLLSAGYVNSYTVFHCPMDDRFEDTEEVVHVKYNKNNVSFEKDLYSYSTYEVYINDETVMDGDVYTDPSAVVSYSKEWCKKNSSDKLPSGIDEEDYARQLKWKNPPTDTVICWCMNHAEYPYSADQNEYPTSGNALVLYLDGHVDIYTDTKQIARATWTSIPNNFAK